MSAHGLTEPVEPLTAAAGVLEERSRFAERTNPPRLPIALLGVAFDNVTLRETVRRIETMVDSRRPHHVVTANVDFLVLARADSDLHRIFLEAPLVLCDGTPLVWASRVLGNPLPERVAGSDLVPELIRVAARKKYRLFFLGTTEEAAAQAVANVRAQFPELKISYYSPPFRHLAEMDHTEILQRIGAAEPDMLFVAFGCPKAEKWIAMHYRALGVPLVMGVGATIDFLAGRMRRAPLWMQRGGLEWLYRMIQEPRRLFKRYLTDLRQFSGAILRQWWLLRIGTRKGTTRISLGVLNENWQRVEVSGCLNRKGVERDAMLWNRVLNTERDCLLALAGVTAIDSAGVALLIQLKRQLLSIGRQLVLQSASPAVRRALRLLQLEEYLHLPPLLNKPMLISSPRADMPA